MKTRYKILWVSLAFISFFVGLIILLGFCFIRVPYNQYAIAHHKVFDTMTDTRVRTKGRYFLGLDMELYTFPRGLLK